MHLSILIPPDRTKYMSSGHCCMYFCFFSFGVYIDIEKKNRNTLQKKALRIIINQPKNSPLGLLFKQNNIPKFEDKILIGNIIFLTKSINNLLPPIFENWFIFCSEIHTVSSSTDKLFKPSYRTDSYGKNSLIISSINCWNKNQNILYGQSLKSLYPSKTKNILTKRCIN